MEEILQNRSPDEYDFKFSDSKWNLKEIICHLLDEERFDFKSRIQFLFLHPNEQPPTLNPPEWVEDRIYKKRNYEDVLNQFISERHESIEWLQDSKEKPWTNHYEHPTLGVLSAKGLLINWVAHDLHHIRQINEINYHFLKQVSGNDMKYAGKW